MRDGEIQNAKDAIDSEGALGLLKGISDLYVAKGKKTIHFDMANDPPADDEVLALIMGRSGKLRAPAIRKGSTLIVGFNPDILTEALG